MSDKNDETWFLDKVVFSEESLPVFWRIDDKVALLHVNLSKEKYVTFVPVNKFGR